MESHEAVLTRVAWLYYIQGLTQGEIAQRLGYSRTKVVRLLAKAREQGLVSIELKSPFGACYELEKRIKEVFGLREAVVVPTGQSEQINKAGIAKAAALLLERMLKDGDVIGASWGTTVCEVGRQLGALRRRDLVLVQMMGGTNALAGPINPLEVVKLLATKLGARGFWLNAPLIVDSAEIKEAIVSDVGVRQVLDMTGMVNVALIGIGDLNNNSSLVACNLIQPEMMVRLMRRGAVGDIFGQYFDERGAYVPSGLEDRMIAFPIDRLKHIPVVIGVAGGARKVTPILGGLRGRLMNVLVTDESTAQQILAANKARPGGRETAGDA